MVVTPMLLLMIVGCEASSSAQFTMLQGQDGNYTLEALERKEDLEYPRRNRRILHLVNRMWNEYYLCLLEKEWEENKPEIRRLLEGQYTELECDICPRPFQDYDELEWKYKPLGPQPGNNELEYLDLTPEMSYTENKTIRIFNAVQSIAGLYVCYHKQNVASIYILEVSKNDTIEKAETMENSVPSIQIDGKEFDIVYRWTDWTECNACGRVGKKFRYGTCYVAPQKKEENDEKEDDDDDDDDDEDEDRKKRGCPWKSSKAKQKIQEVLSTYKSLSIAFVQKLWQRLACNDSTPQGGDDFQWDLEIMEKFSTGIPCESQYLPKSVFDAIKHPKSVKVLVKFCWEPCRETEIFEIRDNNGRLIESANNTAGVYSVFQTIPQIPHDIERRTISADYGTNIIIQCPGTSFSNTPFLWKINDQIVFPDLVAKESRGRFTIDLVSRINLKKLRLKDSRIYSCWQKDKLVGTVNLNVDKKFKIVLDHHVTLIGIILLSGALLLLASKMVIGQLNTWK